MESRRSFLLKSSAIIIFSLAPGCSAITMSQRTFAPMKTRQPKRALMLWYSQTGNTRRNGRLIAKIWEKHGLQVDASDIRKCEKTSMDQYDLVMIGSPVYYYDVPDNVKDWLSSIPRIDGTPVASYTTFGGKGSNQNNTACLLLELLTEKGGVPVGFASFGNMSTFAPEWSWSEDFAKRVIQYKHLPNKATYKKVREYASAVISHVRDGKSHEINKEFSFGDIKKYIASAKVNKLLIGKHTIDGGKCVECGTCSDVCPVGAIDPSLHRVDTDKCIACMGCVNNCPEKAVDMEYMGKKVYGFLEFMERNNIKIEEPKE